MHCGLKKAHTVVFMMVHSANKFHWSFDEKKKRVKKVLYWRLKRQCLARQQTSATCKGVTRTENFSRVVHLHIRDFEAAATAVNKVHVIIN